MYLLFLIEMNINVLHCDGYEPNSCFFFSGKPNKYRFGEQSLGPKRREAKATQIESIPRKLSNDRAEVILLGDSVIKNIERFAPKYFTFLPASTVLIGSITSRCSGKEPALLPRTHGWTRELGIVNFDQ